MTSTACSLNRVREGLPSPGWPRTDDERDGPGQQTQQTQSEERRLLRGGARLGAAGASVDAVTDVLYHRSGLLGVSGIGNDMRALLASPAPEAAEAVPLIAYRVGRELGSLAAALGASDALVFTAGIGEHAAPVRARVCEDAAWLGVRLDPAANLGYGPRISTADSPVSVWVIPTDEELMIARHTLACIRRGGPR